MVVNHGDRKEDFKEYVCDTKVLERIEINPTPFYIKTTLFINHEIL